MDMEQQKHYQWEDKEEEDAALQLQGRQSGTRNESTVPNVIPSYKGNRRQEEEAEKAKSNYDELNQAGFIAAATGFAEINKKGTISGVEFFISEEINPADEQSEEKAKKLLDIETGLITEVVGISHQNVKKLGDDILSTVQVESCEEETKISFEHLDHTNELDVDVDLNEDVDLELTEYDVEEVIEKQNTHDLFCPNCKSCITRRVILRRRKPRIGKGKEQEVLTCLSCFSFLIRTASGIITFAGNPFNTGINQPNQRLKDIPVKPPKGEGEGEGEGGEESTAPEPVPTGLPSQLFGSKTPKDTLISSKEYDSVVGNRNTTADHSDIEKIINTDTQPAKQDEESDADDVIVTVEPVEPASSTGIPAPGDDTRTPEADEWDILKSIVYGGLVESITSLGVVSSAAGAGATTLNIFAMGMANLIAGLFILGHNLRELKNEQYGENSSQSNERYQKLLGRGENFSLHATLAVISFLFFGLLPPVIYGFSFRESNNRDLKLVAVLGASLICIILLAIAKCRVNKQPLKTYPKTILYYISTGVVASCVSYLVGELIKGLLEKLGWFDSTSTLAVSFIETSKPMESTWASF